MAASTTLLPQAVGANPADERALRQAGRRTAKQYTWTQILQRQLLPRLRLLGRAACSGDATESEEDALQRYAAATALAVHA